MANPNIPEFHKYEGDKTWIKNQVESVFNDTVFNLNNLEERIVSEVPNDKITSILSDFKGKMEKKKSFSAALRESGSAGFTLALQIALKKLGYEPGPLDGIYKDTKQTDLSQTMKAVKSFQINRNNIDSNIPKLDDDGIAGPLTLERILEELGGGTTVQQPEVSAPAAGEDTTVPSGTSGDSGAGQIIVSGSGSQSGQTEVSAGEKKEVVKEVAEEVDEDTELLNSIAEKYKITGCDDLKANTLKDGTPTISGTVGGTPITIKFDKNTYENPVLQVESQEYNLYVISSKEGGKPKIHIVPNSVKVLQKFKNYASSLQIGGEQLSDGKFDLSKDDKVTIVFEQGKEKIRVDFDNQAQLISGQTVNVGNKSYKVSIEGGGIVLTESEEAESGAVDQEASHVQVSEGQSLPDLDMFLNARFPGFKVAQSGKDISIVKEIGRINVSRVIGDFQQNVASIGLDTNIDNHSHSPKGSIIDIEGRHCIVTSFEVKELPTAGGKTRGELKLRMLENAETNLFKAVKFTDYTKVTDVNEDKGKITAKYKGVSIEFSGDNLTMTHNKQDYPLYYKQGEEFDINNSATQIVNLQKISKYIGENLKDDFKYDLSGKNGEITLHHTDGTKINFKDGVLTDYVTNNKNIYLNTKDRLVIEENIKGEVSLLSLKDELAKLVFLTQDDKTGSFSAPTNFTEIVNKYTELTSNNGLLNKMSDNNQIKKEYNAVKDKMQEWIKIRDLYEKINANKDKLGSDFEIDPQEGAPITFLKKKGSRRAPLISTKEDGSLVFSKRILRDKQLNALSS